MFVGPDRTEEAPRAAIFVASAVRRQATAVASAAGIELPHAEDLERSINELRGRHEDALKREAS
jgi:hypothetical protein